MPVRRKVNTMATSPRNRRTARTAPAADAAPATDPATPDTAPDPATVVDTSGAPDTWTPATCAAYVVTAASGGPTAIITALATASGAVRGAAARAVILSDPAVIGAVAPYLSDPTVGAAWTAFGTGGRVDDPASVARVAQLAVAMLADLVGPTWDVSGATDADRAAAAAMVDRMLTAADRRSGGSGPRQVIGRQHTALIGRTLTLVHGGRTVTATVVADADNARTGVAVRIGRQSFASVSAAARAVVRSSANGWAVWSTDVDGTSVAIGDAYDAGSLNT